MRGGTLHGVDVGVLVTVGGGEVFVGVAVKVGTEIVAGSPTTRATRNFSTKPSRRAVSLICGTQELIMGEMMG
jgi:hypothetical protein